MEEEGKTYLHCKRSSLQQHGGEFLLTVLSHGSQPDKSEAVLRRGRGEEDQLNKVALMEAFRWAEEFSMDP